MIEYDTSQYPAGALGWQSLLAAVENASPADESDWIEFKANLDVSQRPARPVLAKAIVAFANREVARAARHLGGRALIVIGLEPGNLVGALAMDPAKLHDAIQPYLAAPAPGWDVQYVTYKGKQVLIVTVSAPEHGDPIHYIAKDSDKVRNGDIYVRHVGQSAPAKSSDLRKLSTRLLVRSHPSLEVDVAADAGDGLRRFHVPEDWVERWVSAERIRLLAPLPRAKPAQESGSGILAGFGFPEDVARQVAELSRPFAMFEQANPLLMQHDESRTEDEYEAEVKAYLDGCRQRLPEAVEVLRKDLSPLVVFKIRNLTDQNFRGLEIHVHAEGDVTAHRLLDRFEGLDKYTARPPRVWGPWTEPRFGPAGGLQHLVQPLRTFPVQSYAPHPGPDIVNGGSADITFPPFDLRPRAEEDLDYDVVLVAGPKLTGDVTCKWSATATNVNGRVEGALTISIADRPMTLAPYLRHGSRLTPNSGE